MPSAACRFAHTLYMLEDGETDEHASFLRRGRVKRAEQQTGVSQRLGLGVALGTLLLLLVMVLWMAAEHAVLEEFDAVVRLARASAPNVPQHGASPTATLALVYLHPGDNDLGLGELLLYVAAACLGFFSGYAGVPIYRLLCVWWLNQRKITNAPVLPV